MIFVPLVIINTIIFFNLHCPNGITCSLHRAKRVNINKLKQKMGEMVFWIIWSIISFFFTLLVKILIVLPCLIDTLGRNTYPVYCFKILFYGSLKYRFLHNEILWNAFHLFVKYWSGALRDGHHLNVVLLYIRWNTTQKCFYGSLKYHFWNMMFKRKIILVFFMKK